MRPKECTPFSASSLPAWLPVLRAPQWRHSPETRTHKSDASLIDNKKQMRVYSPIQLLRPLGLCNAVCPTLINPNRASLSICSSRAGSNMIRDGDVTSDPRSSASANELGASEGVPESEGVPFEGGVLSWDRSPTNAIASWGKGKNASACHSYQTWRSFVSLHIDTCSSQLLGKYKGSFETRIVLACRFAWMNRKRTLLTYL